MGTHVKNRRTKGMLSKRTFMLWIFVMATMVSYAQTRFAIRNNLLYDLTFTPNLSVDFPIAPHWTLGGTVGYNPWWHHGDTRRHAIFLRGNAAGAENEVQWRHLLVMPEARYWFFSKPEANGENAENGNAGQVIPARSFIGFNLLYSHYNVGNVRFPFGMYKSVRSKRRQGDAYAVGASFGHIWHLGGPFYMEGELGLDVGITKFDNYECAHCGAKLGTDTKPFLVPKAGLSLVFAPGKKPILPPPPVSVDTDTIVVPPFQPVLAVVPEFGGVADSLMKTHPVLQHKSQYRPYDDTRILRKEEGALYVHFPLDKYDLRRDFRDNAGVLDQIMEITRLIMADTTSSVSCIQIIGLASIEGRLPHNQELSRNRAKALQAYVQLREDVPDNLFETIAGGEAWTEFRDQINDVLSTKNQVQSTKKDGEPTREELEAVLQIIDTEKDLDKREQKIRKLNGGRTYTYLKNHLLADQRNSGYIRIYWDHVPDVKAQIINQASQLVQQEKYEEALRLLQDVKSDPRSYNTLAVALYQTGNYSEALRYFRLAAAAGNAQAQKNLEQLKVQR